MELVSVVYDAMQKMPKEELYSLTDQIKRAAVSVPSNIAEGQVKGKKEFRRFLRISLGSLAELETQLMIAINLNMLERDLILPIFGMITSLKKQIRSLIQKL